MDHLIKQKINVVYLSVALLFTLLFSNLNAQIAIGAGGVYGTDIEQFAPNLRAYYFPNEKICFGPEVAWFPEISEGEVERQLTEFNITGHYIFEVHHKVGAYPLFGFNYSIEKETEHDEEITEEALGLNLGAGLHLSYGRFLPFVEYKYVTGDLSQHAFSAGVLFILFDRKKQKHESVE